MVFQWTMILLLSLSSYCWPHDRSVNQGLKESWLYSESRQTAMVDHCPKELSSWIRNQASLYQKERRCGWGENPLFFQLSTEVRLPRACKCPVGQTSFSVLQLFNLCVNGKEWYLERSEPWEWACLCISDYRHYCWPLTKAVEYKG